MTAADILTRLAMPMAVIAVTLTFAAIGTLTWRMPASGQGAEAAARELNN